MTTVTPRASTDAHLTAVKALLTAAFSTMQNPFAVLTSSEVQNYAGNLPAQYVDISVRRRNRPKMRMDARDLSSSHRITVVYVGDTEANANLVGDACAAALEDTVMTINGRQTGLIQFDVGDAVAPDGAMHFSGLTDYRYTL